MIVERAAWGARRPRSVRTMPTPTTELWLHHTAGNEPDGPSGVRQIQNFHMDGRKWVDIAYSFLVDRNGAIFEGRGAGIVGAHTSGHNDRSHAICLIGNYEQQRPTKASLEAIAWLVRHGRQEGWWTSGITGGHRQASGSSTTCPGGFLLSQIPAINRAAEQSAPEGAPVKGPVFYAEGRDVATACGWVAAARRGVFTASADEAKRAADAGLEVVAVGGPAVDTLNAAKVPHRPVRGADGPATYRQLAQ